jgi:hypothetical protein
MPVFLDGQQNLAALTVPGVYGDIILPTPLLLGTPTNIEGLVGVGSWGPTNFLIAVSDPTSAALAVGPPVIRTYDMSTYVSAASQVGGAIAFYLVRVTDGTDVAASGQLGAVAAVAASGSILLPTNPTNNSTVTVGGTVVTFVTSGATGNQVNIGGTVLLTAAALLAFLQGSADTNISKCSYAAGSPATTIVVTDKTLGTAGNSFTLATNVSGGSVSGATLAGGAASYYGASIAAKYTGILGNGIQVSIQNGTLANSYLAVVAFPGLPPEQFNNIPGSGNTFWQNLVNAINNGTAYHGPSNFVVATAGTSTAAPTVSSPVQLSGGTDGASGVTDATLMGQDTLPRKGMYVLRNAGVDCFTLCDHDTSADWAAMGSFGLEETCYPIVATESGDSYTDAISTRTSAGVDTPWFKILLGDWPTFYDSYNGVSRLVSPAAFAIGIFGNLSPQQSSLNKPLQGISATQTSTSGQTYSDAELSIINNGGIDVILPAVQSPGGFYYSFATGRNASSNTAANGDEYTRMTNFLIRTAQSKAAGSFIGQLQSIQPNDQTRANAKSLFDGFSAQLASPQVGLGINGQGMIDGWATQCDLNNNPPNLQALGYLFLYWQVRYLNVIRYFVVKFQGGGNVQVTVQSTAPTAAQFSSTANAGTSVSG